MKILLLSLFMIAASYGAELVKVKDYRNNQYKVSIDLEKRIMSKETNFFDQKEDYSLGIFYTNSENFVKFIKSFNTVSDKLSSVNALLSEKGKTFNNLNDDSDHSSYYLLAGNKIYSTSSLYAELDELFNLVLSLNWHIQKGVKLENNFTKLLTFNLKKIEKEEKFDLKFSCLSPMAPTVCALKNYGQLYIGK